MSAIDAAVALFVICWLACGVIAWLVLWFRNDIDVPLDGRISDVTAAEWLAVPISILAGPVTLWLVTGDLEEQ